VTLSDLVKFSTTRP